MPPNKVGRRPVRCLRQNLNGRENRWGPSPSPEAVVGQALIIGPRPKPAEADRPDHQRDNQHNQPGIAVKMGDALQAPLMS